MIEQDNSKLINKIVNDNCLVIMNHIEDKSVDMIFADLPYQVTNRNSWDIMIPFVPLWEQLERVIKNNGAIIFTAIEPFSSKLIISNEKLFRYDLIYEKPLATGFLNANRMPLRNHEQILVFYKKLPVYNPQFEEGKPYKISRRGDSMDYGKVKELHWTSESDGKRYPKSVLKFAADKEKLHPTQKPLKLLEWLIKTYSNENDLILDPVMGSGTTCVAAKKLNRRFIGIEKEEKFFNIAKERLNKV